jgi:hypothetical protein
MHLSLWFWKWKCFLCQIYTLKFTQWYELIKFIEIVCKIVYQLVCEIHKAGLNLLHGI